MRARRPGTGSSDLTARRAASDHDDGCRAKQHAQQGAAEWCGRPEGKPRHETPLPALSPLSHRHLQGRGEGRIDRLRRVPEAKEALVTDLAGHVCEIPVADYEALFS